VKVDASLAHKFSGMLAAMRAAARDGRGDEPFFDFNHEDGEASGHPVRFYWGGEDPKTGGIRAEVKWTSAGEAALRGRTFRRFSPQWLTDEDTLQPLGIGVNLGGLVNRAAFQTIQPVVAKSATVSTATHQQQHTMTEADKQEISNLITAAVKPITDRLAQVEAKQADAGKTATTQAADALQLADMIKRLEKIETSAKSSTEAEADLLVQAACADGRIPAQDEDAKKFWKELLVVNASAKGQLAKLPKNPALATLVNGGATATHTAAGGGHAFIVKAKEYAKANGITDELDAQAKFAGTKEGSWLYREYTEQLATEKK